MLRRSFSPAGCPGFGGLVVFGRLSRYNRRILRRESAPTEDDILHLLRSLRGTASPREMAEALGKRHAGPARLAQTPPATEEAGPGGRGSPRPLSPGTTASRLKPRANEKSKRAIERRASPRAQAARFSASDPHVLRRPACRASRRLRLRRARQTARRPGRRPFHSAEPECTTPCTATASRRASSAAIARATDAAAPKAASCACSTGRIRPSLAFSATAPPAISCFPTRRA